MERKVIPIIDNDATAKEEDGREETTAIEDAMPIEIATRWEGVVGDESITGLDINAILDDNATKTSVTKESIGPSNNW